MDLYPLNLVLAAGLAWASIFLGALPTRLLRAPVFARLVGYCGGAWMVVAILAPAQVIHYYVLIGALCLYAWRQLRHEAPLSGKGWLMVAAGSGISLGVVLILAVTPGAFPPGTDLVRQLAAIVPLYVGGAILGLALALYFFTRREATREGISATWVGRLAGLLAGLTFFQAVMIILFALGSVHLASDAVFVLVMPLVGAVARRRVRSPAPSTSGSVLLGLGVIEALTVALWLGLVE